MKIIHFVLGKANPNRMNGVNKVVHQLSQTQKELGYDVEIWGITPTPNDFSEIPERDVTTKLFHSNKHKVWIDPMIKKSLKQINYTKVVHMHGGFIPEYFHLHKILKNENIPYVVTPHGCYNLKSIENGEVKKKTYFNLFEKKMLLNAKRLHCLGKSEKNAVNQLAPKINTVVIPNGQSMEDLQFDLKKITKANIPIFGFCGRMDKKMKGLDLLIKGFAKYIHNENKKGQLWLIGGGHQIKELKQLVIDLNLDNDVIFFGPQFGEEKLNLLANCSAFYHPSRYEGLPMSILEAAGIGLPCVVSDATNFAEYIANNNAGIVLDPNNENNICESMKTVLNWYEDKTQLRNKSRSAKIMIQKLFGWEGIAKRFIEVYQA